jgi:hypothetical protein
MRQIALMGTLFLSGALLLAGCECDAGVGACDPGERGCACASGERCLDDGYMCVEGRCIDPTDPPDLDAGPEGFNDSGDHPPPPEPEPNPDAFWVDDPPPMQCLEDGSMGPLPDPPGGTPECPDDRNREGCRCDSVGEDAPCWPGRRVNRNRGICRDGTTTCEMFDEFGGAWGECRGYVLPTEGVIRGPGACRCFSEGTWAIENLGPCFITDSARTQVFYSVSTNPDTGQCPFTSPPMSAPATHPLPTWSEDTLVVDCEGRFQLCYTLKAGNAEDPRATDCTVARVCTDEFWYQERDVVQQLPPLPSWVSTENACAQQFVSSGGYGEMSVIGLSVECDPIDDGSGEEYVFNRVNYCALDCPMRPTDPDCVNCGRGGSGMF